MNRADFVLASMNAPVAAVCSQSKGMTQDPYIAELSARMHMFVRSTDRSAFIDLFRGILQCELREIPFAGLDEPVIFVSLPCGGSFSVETTPLAPTEANARIDDGTALRGAWLEFRSDQPGAAEDRLMKAGIPSFRHAGSPHVYFSAPGGQVFRVVARTYNGP